MYIVNIINNKLNLNTIKLLIYMFFITFSMIVKSDNNFAYNIFRDRLNQINNLHANFIQKLYSVDQKLIEISKGELWLKRPNLFYWHIIEPEENFLISDGKTIWFYVPLINQVIAYSLNTNVISDNLFLQLFLNDSFSTNQNYCITQKNDWFYLKPIYFDISCVREYQIEINNCGIIDHINIIEDNGQHIDYELFKHSITTINMNKFQFILPKDVQLDDQRN